MSEIIKPMNRENDEDDFVLGYMCLVDFECEIGAADDGNRVYPSERSLRERLDCVEHCGIVEVKVSFVRIVHPGKEYDFGAHPDTLTDEAKARRSAEVENHPLTPQIDRMVKTMKREA